MLGVCFSCCFSVLTCYLLCDLVEVSHSIVHRLGRFSCKPPAVVIVDSSCARLRSNLVKHTVKPGQTHGQPCGQTRGRTWSNMWSNMRSNAGTDTGGIQNRLGVLFFALLYLSLMALSSLPVWREERLLYCRERDGGLYRSHAYCLAVALFDVLPLRVVPPFFFALCAYWVIGLHPSCGPCILWFCGVLVGANITAALMCMAIGAAAPSNAVANMVASLTMMMLMLFGGFLLNKERVPTYCRWASHASYFNYAYEVRQYACAACGWSGSAVRRGDLYNGQVLLKVVSLFQALGTCDWNSEGSCSWMGAEGR